MRVKRATAPIVAKWLCSLEGSGLRGKRGAPLGRAFELARNVAADQITQGKDGRVGDFVIGAGATAFAIHQALLSHQGQVPRHIGRREAAHLGQFTDIALTRAQDVQDLQTRGFGQDLKVSRNFCQRAIGQLFHGAAVGRGGDLGWVHGEGWDGLCFFIVSLHN